MTKATNKITQQEAHILHLEMLRKVTGQLAALQQANDTLVEKWRAKATEVISPENAELEDELFSF